MPFCPPITCFVRWWHDGEVVVESGDGKWWWKVVVLKVVRVPEKGSARLLTCENHHVISSGEPNKIQNFTGDPPVEIYITNIVWTVVY